MNNNDATRRRFLTTAVAAGIPTIVPSHVLGRGGAVPPSDRVTTGFIGLGNRAFRWQNAKLLISASGMPECRILAVCDVDGQRRDEVKAYVDKTYNNSECTAFRDFREMLDRKDIDSVFVVTPHHWHAIMAIMGINAGKNVYCEKPVSKTIREAMSLGAAARRTKKVVQAGTQARTSPLQAYAVKQIQSGAIGDVKKVLVGCFGQPNRSDVVAEPTPPYMDWEMFVGPAPMCPYSKLRWSFRKELSGGIIIDWGQHFFDVAQWGLGMDHTGPVEVLPAGYQDHEFVTLRYANGAEVMLHAKDGKALSEGTTFIGTKGKIFIHAWNDEVTFEPAEIGAAYYREAKLEQPKAITGIWNNALSDKHVASFFDCVRNGKKTNAPMENAHRSVTLGHLTNISLWTMRPLKWNPDKFEFVDDREANAYLHIPPREPWKV